MGRIRDFFNKIFGRKQKALSEAKENVELETNAISRDFPKEEKEDKTFKEELGKDIISQDEMSFDDTLDYFINSQGIEEICKNPRGREKIGNILKEVLKKEHVKDENGVYSRIDIDYAIKGALGEIQYGGSSCLAINGKNEIVYEDRDFYELDSFRENSDMAPGKKKTTISVDKYGSLSEVEDGRSSYSYNMERPEDRNKPTSVYFYKRKKEYSKTGLQETQEYLSCNIKDMNMSGQGYDKKPSFDYALLDRQGANGYPEYRREFYRRRDGIVADISITENGEHKSSSAYLNTEYDHIDDIYIAGDGKGKIPEYKDMTPEEKEKFNTIAKDGISRSKYKEALVSQTPGIEMEDIEQNKNRD